MTSTDASHPIPSQRALMATEAMQAAASVRQQSMRSSAQIEELSRRLRQAPPRFVVTCARGSSDHAALYGKYLIETQLGLPVASVGPSIASVYHRDLDMRETLLIAVSQSGRSPDLLKLAETAKRGGALVVGLINDETSPLFEMCDIAIGLSAGTEQAVAATKSFLTSAFAFLNLVAHWSDNPGLRDDANALPSFLDKACALDWGPDLASLSAAQSLYVIGRGVGFGIAQEMALKFKETSCLHAEAFSAAEVAHGPMALVRNGFPVLALTQSDAAHANTQAVLERMVELGGHVLIAGSETKGAVSLPVPQKVPASIAPLCHAQSFYLGVPQLARARGFDPDRPLNLQKVTKTV